MDVFNVNHVALLSNYHKVVLFTPFFYVYLQLMIWCYTCRYKYLYETVTASK